VELTIVHDCVTSTPGGATSAPQGTLWQMPKMMQFSGAPARTASPQSLHAAAERNATGW